MISNTFRHLTIFFPKRRRRNSPCMREDVTMVLVMAGMKVLMMFAAAHWRATGIIMMVLRKRERLQRSNGV